MLYKNFRGQLLVNYSVAFVLLLIVSCLPATAYPALIERVIDGDTVILGNGTHVRLAAIDSPEHNQPFGPEAKAELELLLPSNTQFEIVPENKDEYGRVIAWIFPIITAEDRRLSQFGHDLHKSPADSINYYMVASGFAWHYKKYNKDKVFDRAEDRARSNKMGLWVDASPIPPWDFRLQQRKHAANRLTVSFITGLIF